MGRKAAWTSMPSSYGDDGAAHRALLTGCLGFSPLIYDVLTNVSTFPPNIPPFTNLL